MLDLNFKIHFLCSWQQWSKSMQGCHMQFLWWRWHMQIMFFLNQIISSFAIKHTTRTFFGTIYFYNTSCNWQQSLGILFASLFLESLANRWQGKPVCMLFFMYFIENWLIFAIVLSINRRVYFLLKDNQACKFLTGGIDAKKNLIDLLNSFHYTVHGSLNFFTVIPKLFIKNLATS